METFENFVRCSMRIVLVIGAFCSLQAQTCQLNGTVTLNFDSVVNAPGQCTDATAYLNSYGVSFSTPEVGASPEICDDTGSPATATSPPNWFGVNAAPGLGNSSLTYTLTFCTPVENLSFSSVGISSNNSTQDLTATVFDANGNQLGQMSQTGGLGTPGQQFNFAGPGIASLNISTGGGAFTFTDRPLDDLILTVTSPPVCAPTVQADSSDPKTVTVNANCTDSLDAITTTMIDWGDGSNQFSGTTASHPYAAAGMYNITVSATDAGGSTGSAVVSTTVTAALPTPVAPGQPVQTTVNVAAPPGQNSVSVTFQCTNIHGPTGVDGSPDSFGLSCGFTPASVTLTSAPVPLAITIGTMAANQSLSSLFGVDRLRLLYGLFCPCGMFLIGAVWTSESRMRSRCLSTVLVLLVFLCLWPLSACGGGSSTSSTNSASGSPPGVYTATITGTDASGTTQATITVGFTITGGH